MFHQCQRSQCGYECSHLRRWWKRLGSETSRNVRLNWESLLSRRDWTLSNENCTISSFMKEKKRGNQANRIQTTDGQLAIIFCIQAPREFIRRNWLLHQTFGLQCLDQVRTTLHWQGLSKCSNLGVNNEDSCGRAQTNWANPRRPSKGLPRAKSSDSRKATPNWKLSSSKPAILKLSVTIFPATVPWP